MNFQSKKGRLLHNCKIG